MSTLFDPAYANDGVIDRQPSPTPVATGEQREVVKCASCGGAILKSVALFIEVNPLGEWTARGRDGVCCRQKACIRAVAQDLAEEWAL